MFDWLKSKKKKPSPAQPSAPAGEMDLDKLQRQLQCAMLCQRACSLVEAGQRAEAAGMFQQAVTLNPSYGLGWADFGTCLMELERYAESAQALERACELVPGDFTCWFHLAKTYAKLDRLDEARKSLREARRIDGHNQRAVELERQIG